MMDFPTASKSARVRAAFLFLLALALGGCTQSGDRSAASPPAAESQPVEKANAAATPPAPAPKAKKTEPVRALYISGWTAGGKERWSQLLSLVDKSELNAVVVDVKEDGMISYDTDLALARSVGAHKKQIRNIDDKLAELKKRNIFAIARITCFRDKLVPKKRPDLAIQRPDGVPWRDNAGHLWLDPYSKENWDYNVDLAIDAAKHGFNEIQWDYVRFPSEGRERAMRFPAKSKDDKRSEARVIAAFLQYAREKLRPHNVLVSADVFGLTTSARPDYDLGIGQKLELMAPHLDYVCPMVYPSHYRRGDYGIPHPNASPYRTVLRALKDGNKKLAKSDCKMRPWLQDFSLGGVRYGERQVRAQIQAARDNGIQEYLLWNAANRYTSAALYPKKVRKKKSRTAATRQSAGATKTARQAAPPKTSGSNPRTAD